MDVTKNDLIRQKRKSLVKVKKRTSTHPTEVHISDQIGNYNTVKSTLGIQNKQEYGLGEDKFRVLNSLSNSQRGKLMTGAFTLILSRSLNCIPSG